MHVLDLVISIAQAASIETHRVPDAVYMHCHTIDAQLTAYQAIIDAQRAMPIALTIDSMPPWKVGGCHRVRVMMGDHGG